VFSSDISSLETSSFGTIPSYEEVKDDLAISTIPNINIGKFSLDLVKTWIETVALSGNSQKISKAKPTIAQIYIDFTYYGNILLAYIESEFEKEKGKHETLPLQPPLRMNGKTHSTESNVAMEVTSQASNSSAPSSVVNDHSHGSASASSSLLTKRKYSDNFSGLFGRTTIANRQQQPSTSFSQQEKLDSFPGKLLLKILPKDIIKQKLTSTASPAGTAPVPRPSPSPSSSQSSSSSSSMVLIPYDENDGKIVNDFFHAAIQRRSSFDKMIQEKQNNLELEKKRLLIEKDTNTIPARKKMIEQNQQHKQQLIFSSNEKDEFTSNESITYLDEIDLEDLVGGPITSVRVPAAIANKPLSSAMKKKVEKSPAAVSPPAAKTVLKKPDIPVIKQEPVSSSTKLTSPQQSAHPPIVKQEPQVPVKTEPIASSSKEAPPTATVSGNQHQPPAETVKDEKKLGMKPRRKIVIS
jgi:hypothetical protein